MYLNKCLHFRQYQIRLLKLWNWMTSTFYNLWFVNFCTDLTEEADCKRTKTGREYVGTRNITASGRTCQTWSSDSPHDHGYNNLPENYCRNPDGEPSPWCYTTDPAKRWEVCEIPDCGKYCLFLSMEHSLGKN